MVIVKQIRVFVRWASPQQARSVVVEHKRTGEVLVFEHGAIYRGSAETLEAVKKDGRFRKAPDSFGFFGTIRVEDRAYLVLITEVFGLGKIGPPEQKAEVYRVTNTHFVQIWCDFAQERAPGGSSSTSSAGSGLGPSGGVSGSAGGGGGGGRSGAVKAHDTGSPAGSPATSRKAQKGEAKERRKLMEELEEICKDTTFYFATGGWDLSRSMQLQHLGTPDERFVWNRSWNSDFEEFGFDSIGRGWVIPLIRGFVQFATLYAGAKQVRAALFGRLSCERVGTRFQVRGADDTGAVANFVETEQALCWERHTASYVQTRGSVPLYWDQPGIQVGAHKLRMARGHEASSAVFDRHMRRQLQLYQAVHIVNLLGKGVKGDERMLGDEYMAHTDRFKKAEEAADVPTAAAAAAAVDILWYDFHAETKKDKGGFDNLASLTQLVEEAGTFREHGFFHSDGGAEPLTTQRGVIRTNCLDCLDRTNVAQGLFGRKMLPTLLAAIGIDVNDRYLERFLDTYKDMWANHGDFVSLLYAGTGAMKSGFTRTGKRTVAGMMDDGAKSVKRMVQNNFKDKKVQLAIDVFLGKRGFAYRGKHAAKRTGGEFQGSAVEKWIAERLLAAEDRYSTAAPVRVFVGTWNVNGGKKYGVESLEPWLFPPAVLACPPDLYVVGFEEIVDLTASNMVSKDDGHRKAWSDTLAGALAEGAPKHGLPSYVLLSCEQLVGVCLYIFVRAELTAEVRELDIDTVKVGMHGLAGNKGGIGMRFGLGDTSFCFICAHLAAGQSNVGDRNEDFFDITAGLEFGVEGSADTLDHDYVVWLGDFNYRIDLPNAEVKQRVAARQWTELVAADQLRQQQAAGRTFRDFIEGELAFAPTYKYDTFTDTYDTSEKQRTPAWTDRVLYRAAHAGRRCRQVLYARAELQSSDHRPVMALYEMEWRLSDPAKQALCEHEAVVAAQECGAAVEVCFPPGAAVRDDVVRAAVSRFGELVEFGVLPAPGAYFVLFKEMAAADAAAAAGSSLAVGPCKATVRKLGVGGAPSVSVQDVRRPQPLDPVRRESVCPEASLLDLDLDPASCAAAGGDQALLGSTPPGAAALGLAPPARPPPAGAAGRSGSISRSSSSGSQGGLGGGEAAPGRPAPPRPRGPSVNSGSSQPPRPRAPSQAASAGPSRPPPPSRSGPPGRPAAPSVGASSASSLPARPSSQILEDPFDLVGGPAPGGDSFTAFDPNAGGVPAAAAVASATIATSSATDPFGMPAMSTLTLSALPTTGAGLDNGPPSPFDGANPFELPAGGASAAAAVAPSAFGFGDANAAPSHLEAANPFATDVFRP